MIGVSAASANIHVIVKAIKLHRSQLLVQFNIIGPTFVSSFALIKSIIFCDTPIVLDSELKKKEEQQKIITNK